MDEATIYTDGACSPNPGRGGWAAVLQCGDLIKEIYGWQDSTTNNRMEMTAVMKALSMLKRPCKVKLYTDSMINIYTCKAGQRKLDKRKNLDLVLPIMALCQIHDVETIWVKGHNGNCWNERCDQLSVWAMKSMKSSE